MIVQGVTNKYNLDVPYVSTIHFKEPYLGYSTEIKGIYKGVSYARLVTTYYEKGTNLKGWDGSLRDKPVENGNYVMIVKGRTFYNREIITTTTVTLIK